MKGEVSVSVGRWAAAAAAASAAAGTASTAIAITIAFIGSVEQPDHSLNCSHNRLGFDD